MDVIGIVPAAGTATRISPLPCSKELYPIGRHSPGPGQHCRPKVVCHYLLERMQFAGVSKAYVVLRTGKWDIPSYFGDGQTVQMRLVYLMMGLPYGVPYTVDQAYPYARASMVAFGFPDIVFRRKDVFVQMLRQHAATKADVVLGLFPTNEPRNKDMVALTEDGQVTRIVRDPRQPNLQYTWATALWTPGFSRFLHERIAAIMAIHDSDDLEPQERDQRELTMGDVFQSAIDQGVKVEGVAFDDDRCLDIGTPDDLVHATSILLAPDEVG